MHVKSTEHRMPVVAQQLVGQETCNNVHQLNLNDLLPNSCRDPESAQAYEKSSLGLGCAYALRVGEGGLQLLVDQQKKILRNRWLRSTGAVSHPPSLADEVDEEGEPEHELTPALRVQALHDIISHCDISARAGSTGTASGGHEAMLLRFDERVESIFPLHDAKANVGFARAVFGFDESGFRPGLKGLLLTTADVRGALQKFEQCIKASPIKPRPALVARIAELKILA